MILIQIFKRELSEFTAGGVVAKCSKLLTRRAF